MENTQFWRQLRFGFIFTNQYLFPQLAMGLRGVGALDFDGRWLRNGNEVGSVAHRSDFFRHQSLVQFPILRRQSETNGG